VTTTVLVAGLCLVLLGGLAGVAPATFRAGLGAQAVGAVMVGAAGFGYLATGTSAGGSFTGQFTLRFGADPLTGLFLGTLGLVAAPALIFSRGYLGTGGRDRAVGVMTSALVLVLAGVLCARGPLPLLAAWELMTLLPAAVILVAHGEDRHAQRAVFTYVAVTHVGGAGTWVAVLLLAKAGAIGAGAIGAGAATLVPGSGLQAAVAVSALVGLGTKAGLMPLHVWLPRAHPIAPAPVSALMSGVMIKIPIYLMVRVLVDWSGPEPTWVGVSVVALGALSAVGGVTYALFEHDLKRLLAMHSIENIGIIVMGIGACLLLRDKGAGTWAALALGAALLHTVNHAVFKSLLFMGAGTFERAAGTLDLDRLGGLLRRLPVTGAAFFVGAMAIAGLPPLNGFASEWLTLQALLHVARYGHVVAGLAGMTALAALATTAAMATFCFVKVIGLVLLGAPRRHPPLGAPGPSAGMNGSVALLALACLALGLAPGLLFSRLVGLAPWAPRQPLQIGLHLPGTGSLPTPAIFLVLLGLSAGLLALRGRRTAAPQPTWACGQVVGAQLHWTSAGFTKPLRLALESVLRPRREIVTREQGGVVQEVSYRGEVPHLIEERLYAPVGRWALWTAARVRRLQSGSLAVYVAYLIGLVLVLLLAVRLGFIG
jgi:hydrogenase-4 component B